MIPGAEKTDLEGQAKGVIDLIEGSSLNVLLMGSAGSGKTTLIEHFRSVTGKNAVVLAPTGVAALNAGGMTIHSFFRFGPDITAARVKKMKKRGMYGKIDVILIDEISMVRADLLDCVDRFLRLNRNSPGAPFGGVQMVFAGDLYQLPPVVGEGEREIFSEYYESEYFFDSRVFRELDYEVIELENIYRQKDASFISILNRIRLNLATAEDLRTINGRFDPEFASGGRDFYLCLTTTNREAAAINYARLDEITARLHTLEAEIEGDCRKSHFPTEPILRMKTGAQVMLLNNDFAGRWVNGTIGKILEIHPREERIVVDLPGGAEEVSPYKWRVHRFVFDGSSGRIETEERGYFRQYPLRLAWAVTIHKSQGKTFDRVIIDTGRGTFSPGQMYVALSRCTSLEGILLRRKAERRHMFVDGRVERFLRDNAVKRPSA